MIKTDLLNSCSLMYLHTTFSDKTSCANSADHEQTAPKIETDQRLHVQKKKKKKAKKHGIKCLKFYYVTIDYC